MYNFEGWTPDDRYGLRVSNSIMQKMLFFCKEPRGRETGGIIVGYYNRNHDCAIVTDCSGPPEDSKLGANWFFRGMQGLQEWIIQLWRKRQRRYYIGEWHFHPLSNTVPSGDDRAQMAKNAKSANLSCPEPILFIVGGDPERNWACDAYLFTIDKGMAKLEQRCEKARV